MPQHSCDNNSKFGIQNEFKKEVLTENQKAYNLKQREIQRVRNREKYELEKQLNKQYESVSDKFNLMMSLVPKDILSDTIKQ